MSFKTEAKQLLHWCGSTSYLNFLDRGVKEMLSCVLIILRGGLCKSSNENFETNQSQRLCLR
jgi:hypothetical protein